MAINFSPFQFPTMREFKKPTNIAEALKEAQPLVTSTLNDVKAYKEQQDRRKLVNDALEGDKVGYEWFNAEDPAHKAVIDEYIRTGSTAGLQGQRNQWLASQERIKQEIKNKEAIQANEAKQAAAKAAEEANAMSAAKAKGEFLDAVNYMPNFKNDDERNAWDEMMRDRYGNMYREWLAQQNEDKKWMAAAKTGENDAKVAAKETAIKNAKEKKSANLPGARSAWGSLSNRARASARENGFFMYNGIKYQISEMEK